MTTVSVSACSHAQDRVGATETVGFGVGTAVVGRIDTVGFGLGAPFAHCATKASASAMPAPRSAVNGSAVA